MTHARWVVVFLAGVGLLGVADPARAQRWRPEPAPRKEYVHFPHGGDLGQILAQRLRETEGWLRGAPVGGRWPADLGLKLNEETLRALRSDPVLRQLVEEMAAKGKGATTLDLERLRALARAFEEKGLPVENPLRPKDPDRPGKPPEPPKARLAPVLPTDRPNVPQGSDGPDDEFQEQIAEWTREMMERLEHSRLGEHLRDSAAWRRTLRELEGFLSDRDGSRFGLAAPGLGNLGERLRLPRNWKVSLPETSWLEMPDVSLPSIGRPNFRLRLPHLDLGGPRFGGPRGFGSGGVEGISSGLLWGLLLILVGVLVWRLAARSRWRRRVAPNVGWAPGPWPVDPDRVATRAELVQAFEHLALLLLGRAARAWNHRDIAAGMPVGADAGKRLAANELATLYEQARYAPAHEPLAGPELVVARRHLCLLAGVLPA